MPAPERATVLTEEQLAANFADIAPPLTNDAALLEANKCLYCHDAPCTIACPTHIDVPAFIKKIATGNLRGSARCPACRASSPRCAASPRPVCSARSTIGRGLWAFSSRPSCM